MLNRPCLLHMQMVGRAGRPQYDTEGVAVIMTQKQAGCLLAVRPSQPHRVPLFLLPPAKPGPPPPNAPSTPAKPPACIAHLQLDNRVCLASPLPALQHVRRYEQLMNGSELVESTLKEVSKQGQACG